MSNARNLANFKPSATGQVETGDIADAAVTSAKLDTNIAIAGNTTLGDASGDSVTINAGTANFAASGARITGDFSNATIANRVAFQTSTTNSQTVVGVIPNGTSTITQLHLFSSSDYTNYSRLAIQNTGSAITFLSDFAGTGSYLPVTFNLGGSERLRIDTSGNVGIGTSSPSSFGSPLSVYSATNPTLAIVSGNANAYLRLYSTSDNNMYLTNTGGSMTMNTANTERMRIDSSGNVGIGTSSPGARLDVNGGRSFFAANSEPYSIYLRYNSSTSGFFIGSPAADTMAFSASSGAERFRIGSAGQLGIGGANYGTSGQVLTSGGSGAAPSWQTVSVTPTAVSDQANSSTGYFALPTGTTAQRPGSPSSGMIRMNTTTGYPEWYDTNTAAWVNFYASIPYSIEYLVIAGGGGGGVGNGGANQEGGGGGGAGGYRSSVSGESSGGGGSAESTLSLTPGTSYTVTVGAGGTGATAEYVGGTQGGSSVFGSITSTGGGYGATANSTGGSGGSGGGGGPNTTGNGGSGTTNQGYAGGAGNTSAQSGGGGGAGSAGQNSNTYVVGGPGGNGVSSNITGSAVTRAGGGGGGSYNSGSGGSGGGGTGANSGASATAGTANTGSGGGGGHKSPRWAANGGSGVVIIRYAGAQRGTGGTVTSSGGYTIHTFTSSGTYTA